MIMKKAPICHWISLLLAAAIFSPSLAEKCKIFDKPYSATLGSAITAFLKMPLRSTAYYPWPRSLEGKPPGDYYQEPDLSYALPRTPKEDSLLQQYVTALFREEHICDSIGKLVSSYVIFMDEDRAMGKMSAKAFSDSSRREFFGKYYLDEDLIFVSGWYGKFAMAFINVQTESLDTLLKKASQYLNAKIPALSQFTVHEFKTPRSFSGESDKTGVNLDTIYSLQYDDRTIMNVFQRGIRIYPDNVSTPKPEEVIGRRFWVFQIAIYFDKEYMP